MTDYNALMGEILRKAGSQTSEVMENAWCEYEPCINGFIGFLSVYDAVRQFVPKSRVIVDLGCYYAAQAWLFDEYEKYVGVDVLGVSGSRFEPPNAEHYEMSIQKFIEEHGDEYAGAFAICSYVPDDEAMRLVRETFNDCLVYYPRAILEE